MTIMINWTEYHGPASRIAALLRTHVDKNGESSALVVTMVLPDRVYTRKPMWGSELIALAERLESMNESEEAVRV